MSSKFGENSKPSANSDAYINSPYWKKKEEKKMLEFETEELSGQLVASSETHKYRTYWIDEVSGLVDLLIVTGDKAGGRMRSPLPFKTVQEAIQYANEQE